MIWKLILLEYELRSPLHVGYHKIGNVQRTRYYIPARNLWASMTERLTQAGFQTSNAANGNYQATGEWLRMHCAFTYFFLSSETRFLRPEYTEKGLCYGDLPEARFERQFLAAHVTTAIQSASRSAKVEGLHEVEYIRPCDDEWRHRRVAGWIFLDEIAVADLGAGLDLWLKELQVGGERRYGFGRLSLVSLEKITTAAIDGYGIRTDVADRPQIQVRASPLLAHTVVNSVQVKGMIEPLVGRETTSDSAKFGRKLMPAKLCWVPGSVVQDALWFSISFSGVWEPA